jgi:hypothetical protein
VAKVEELGKAGLTGWRKQVGDRLAGPIAQRTPVKPDQVRALVGVAFFALSTYYVVSTALRMARTARS